MKIKLVTFDLDNTLWSTQDVILRATHATQDWLVERVPEYSRLNESDMQNARQLALRENSRLAADVSKLREAVIYESLKILGLNSTQASKHAKRAFDVFYQIRQQVEPYPAGGKLLERLSRDYMLASITNGNADVQLTSIGGFFDFVITAAEVGAMKPAPEPFQAALELAKVKPHEAVHVGDNLVDDIQGAQSVGMQAIWVSNEAIPLEDARVRSVSSLDEVESALKTFDR